MGYRRKEEESSLRGTQPMRTPGPMFSGIFRSFCWIDSSYQESETEWWMKKAAKSMEACI
jgi:hypothetical protein